MSAPSSTPEDLRSWSRLLDQLEERLRLTETSVLPNRQTTVEIGPPVDDSDIPPDPPTPEERLRLLALLAAHDRLLLRLEARQRALRQARHYRLIGG